MSPSISTNIIVWWLASIVTGNKWFSTFGADGLEIAPNSASTFSVDYAGSISDTTPPLQPNVAAYGDDSTTLGGRDVVDWTYTNGASVSRNNLDLTFGVTYYVSAGARNAGGLWSESGISNGVVAGIDTTYFIYLPLVVR